jgi:hypothetical protein
MRIRTVGQITSAITVAACPLSAMAMGNSPYRTAILRVDVMQDWKFIVLSILSNLRAYLACGGDTREDLQSTIESLRECYYAQGLPRGADLACGRSLVENLYVQILADPGVLTPTERTRFLLDLTQMYIALGGNPLELGAVGAGQ